VSTATRAEALLRFIEERRRAERAAILSRARAEAATLLREAHAAARERVRAGLETRLKRARAELAAAEARRETRRRLALQKERGALLALGRARLADALRKRWENANTRALWIEHYAAGALRVLPKQGWEIRHLPLWPPEEQRALQQRLLREGVETLRYAPDETIGAGIRIHSGDSVLDGTLEGMLEEGAAIEGRMLHLLESGAA
jgi:hypothetical protein